MSTRRKEEPLLIIIHNPVRQREVIGSLRNDDEDEEKTRTCHF